MERNILRLGELPVERPARPSHIVIAHSDAEYVTDLQEALQLRGSFVHVAHSGEQARVLARRYRAVLVVLDSDMSLESGWLTADKLARENPRVRVILVTPELTDKDRIFASFVQATAVVDRVEGPGAILEKLDELEGAELAGK
jgi:DNA-binding response OmpR family regulator